MEPTRDIGGLIALMAALRTPGSGCPWDLAQSFRTIAPYTIEEAYEVADAIERGDLGDLKDELGDLLLQVVFHARMAEECGAFAFGDVVEAITAKLIRRHPHVFGAARDLSPEAVKALWDEIKREEKAERARSHPGEAGLPSALDGVPTGLPALTRADKLARKAARVGFDWVEPGPILDKLEEEIGELREALARGERAAVADELGDLLFTVANLARRLEVDPEAALRGTNAKFERRFRAMETELRGRGRTPEQTDLAELEELWQRAKANERGA
jgi:nucleoside triphosphate diphosphatase